MVFVMSALTYSFVGLRLWWSVGAEVLNLVVWAALVLQLLSKSLRFAKSRVSRADDVCDDPR